MLRTAGCAGRPGAQWARWKVLTIALIILCFGLSISGQPETVPSGRPQVVPPSTQSANKPSRLGAGETRVNDLASRIAEAATEDVADAALASDPGAFGEGFGRALFFEIIKLKNRNVPGEKILAVAQRLLRYSKRPEMANQRGFAHRAAGIAYANLERWDLAEKELLAAIGLFRRSGPSGQRDLGSTYRDLAAMFYQKRDQLRTLEYYEKVRLLAVPIDDKENYVHACHGIAAVYFQRGDFQRAYESLELALPAADKIEDKTLKIATLGLMGFAALNQGRSAKAVEAYETAYRTAADSGSPLSANYLFESARAHIKLGDLSSAYSRFRKVHSESVRDADRRLYIYSLLNIAWIHKQYAQDAKAIELYERTVGLADQEIANGSESNRRAYISAKAEAFNRLAEIHVERGDIGTALDLYSRNLKILQSVRPIPETEVRMRASAPDSIAILELGINRDMGDLQSSLGNYAEASAHFASALGLAERIGYENGVIDVMLSMATHAARVGDPEKAFSQVSLAELRIKRNGRLDQLMKLRTITAGIQRRLNRPAAADLSFQEAVRISETLRTDVVMPDERASYFSSLFAAFDEYIDFLMERHEREPDAGFDAKAFNVSERRRARALLDSLRVARADIRHGVELALLEQENRIRNQLNSAAREQFSTTDLQFRPVLDDDPLKTLVTPPKSDIALLIAELARVETEIRRQSPRYAELMQPRPLRWGGIQTLLDEKTVLFNYTLGEKRSFLWTITQDGIRSFILPPRSEIETLVKTVYNELSENPSEREPTSPRATAAESLSRILLQPAAESIGSKRIIIIADGALQFLPFSSLPDPRTLATTKEPILVSNEIQFAPSASVVAVLRQEAERRSAPARSVAIFADPVFSADDERFENVKGVARPAVTRTIESLTSRDLFDPRFLSRKSTTDTYGIPRLPFSRREAEDIFSIAPADASFRALDFEASRERLARLDLSKYGIVHFATHGIVHSEYPQLSGVVLSLFNEKGEPVDGFLRLNEIYNLKLNAELVVLSACQTALGKEVRGEGLIGLTRGFMYAGSPRVLASLWKVDDVATAELMAAFYRKMLKENMRPASALRAAKIEMLRSKRWTSAYYWAAFELQGEWR